MAKRMKGEFGEILNQELGAQVFLEAHGVLNTGLCMREQYSKIHEPSSSVQKAQALLVRQATEKNVGATVLERLDSLYRGEIGIINQSMVNKHWPWTLGRVKKEAGLKFL